jgi:hypothetical protein
VIPVLAENAVGRDFGGSDIEDVADVDSVTSAALRFRDGALVTLATACTLDWQQQAAGGAGARTDRSRQRAVISGR